jgi:hypothetical protein
MGRKGGIAVKVGGFRAVGRGGFRAVGRDLVALL